MDNVMNEIFQLEYERDTLRKELAECRLLIDDIVESWDNDWIIARMGEGKDVLLRAKELQRRE
jgi:hypothetical protein